MTGSLPSPAHAVECPTRLSGPHDHSWPAGGAWQGVTEASTAATPAGRWTVSACRGWSASGWRIVSEKPVNAPAWRLVTPAEKAGVERKRVGARRSSGPGGDAERRRRRRRCRAGPCVRRTSSPCSCRTAPGVLSGPRGPPNSVHLQVFERHLRGAGEGRGDLPGRFVERAFAGELDAQPELFAFGDDVQRDERPERVRVAALRGTRCRSSSSPSRGVLTRTDPDLRCIRTLGGFGCEPQRFR